MTLKERVGLRIKVLRGLRGLTQDELGERIGRSADAISQIERGVNSPSFQSLERLAQSLDVEVSDIFQSDTPDATAKRIALTATITDLVARLSDSDLEIAADQINALVSRRSQSE